MEFQFGEDKGAVEVAAAHTEKDADDNGNEGESILIIGGEGVSATPDHCNDESRDVDAIGGEEEGFEGTVIEKGEGLITEDKVPSGGLPIEEPYSEVEGVEEVDKGNFHHFIYFVQV